MATNYTESSLATLYHNRTIPIPKNLKARFPENIKLNNKIRIYQGDICELPVDAIVNAANKSLLGGGGIDGAIHKAAGPQLKAECKKLNGAETGEAKITKAYGRLACKHVIHTVGPVYLAAKDKKIRNRTKLISCYYESFERAKENKCKSIAFCCISTGVYSYPNEDAAHVALTTVRKYLEELNKDDKIEEVVFCLFLDKDVEIYKRLVPLYFPPTADDIKESQKPKIKDAKDQETMEEVFEDMSELDDDVDEKLKIANQTKAGDLIEEEEEKVMEKINTIPSTNEDTEVESPVKKKLKVEEETEKSEKVETSERTEKENEEKKNVEDVEKPTSDEESKKKAVEKDKTLSSDEEDWEKVEKD